MLKRFILLASGSAAGQFAMLVALPIVTSLYSPSEFGMLGSFTALIMLIQPAAAMRYDLAIPIPESEEEASALAVLSLLFATAISLLVAMAMPFAAQLGDQSLSSVIVSYGWLVGLTLWAAAVFSVTQFWAIRKDLFKQLALAHASRGFLGAGTQIGLGLWGNGVIGLLFGQAIYLGLGSIVLLVTFIRLEFHNMRNLSLGFVVQTARRNWRFPAFSVPETLFSAAGAGLPILLISSFSGMHFAGLVYFANRIAAIPIGVTASALSRVYLGEAPKQEAEGKLYSFTIRIVRNLFLMGSVPFLLVFFGAPYVFDRYLGAEWASAAHVLQLLLPAAFIQFCVSPVSGVFAVRSRQFTFMVIEAVGLLLQVGLVLLFNWTGLAEPILGLAIGSTTYRLIYALGVFVVSRNG